jgi:hypothetical protein
MWPSHLKLDSTTLRSSDLSPPCAAHGSRTMTASITTCGHAARRPFQPLAIGVMYYENGGETELTVVRRCIHYSALIRPFPAAHHG